jgi:hypothetical protein
MRYVTLSHGIMPSFEEFSKAFDRECPRGVYGITPGMGHDPVMEAAAGDHTARELYDMCERLADEWGDEDVSIDDSGAMLASAIMSTLGFEWV